MNSHKFSPIQSLIRLFSRPKATLQTNTSKSLTIEQDIDWEAIPPH